MPRLVLKLTGLTRDQHIYRTAEAAEAGGLAYVTATDMLNTRMDLMTRCLMASVAWYFYSDMVDAMPYPN
jgi:hypothetical protein